MKFASPLLFLSLAFTVASSLSHAALVLSGPSSEWTPLGNHFDPVDDLQTGDPSSDIVGGSGGDSGFFTKFDGLGDASNQDGVLAFRVRLDDHGGNNNNPDFDRNIWVGIDVGVDADDYDATTGAPIEGRVDVFLGASRAGSGNQAVITSPGNDANTSPSTTSIVTASAPYVYALDSTTQGAINFNYRPVEYADGVSSLDLTLSTIGDTDYYVSFSINFADLVLFLQNSSSNTTITEDSTLQYVVGSSTQANAFNQDIGGTSEGPRSTIIYSDGLFSDPVTGTGVLIPEPKSLILLALSSMLLLRRKRA